MKKDLVSIVTPSYKSEMYIAETILSVISQTYVHWELLIIDDKSPDNSNCIIEEFIKTDNRIKIYKLEKNSGVAIARNIGISKAKGKYLTFIDSDDVWNKDFIEKSIKFMNDKGCYFTFSSYERCNSNLEIILKPFIVPDRVSYYDILKTNSISCLTAFIDIENISKNYMEIVGHEDYTLWLKILKKVEFAYGIKEPLAKYRIQEKSLSRNKFKAALWQWKIYRKVEKLNIFKSLYYFFFYAYYGIKKYQ